MAVNLTIVQEVQSDIGEAFTWYENQRVGLGEEYLSCVDACMQQIHRMPESYQAIYKNFRRGLVRRFPYAIFYEYSGKIITIYAVFHTSRNPQKWKARISA